MILGSDKKTSLLHGVGYFALLAGFFGNLTARADDSWKKLFELEKDLPRAVCDVSLVSRAPTLVGEGAEPNRGRYIVPLKMSEPEALSALMDDSASLFTKIKGLETRESRMKVSLEICKGLVTVGGLTGLMSAQPDYFLSLERLSGVPLDLDAIKNSSEPTTLVIQDVRGRFASTPKGWRAGGWIESSEVLALRSGSRWYVRMTDPVTNNIRIVQIRGPRDQPLGFIYPSGGGILQDWDTLLSVASGQERRKKLFEVYRMMIEREAFMALETAKGSPAKLDEIRRLQDFYKNLMSAYQLYPEDSRFLDKKSPGSFVQGSEGLKRILDTGFFSALK